MINFLWLALDAFFIYIGVKQENYLLLMIVAISLLMDFIDGIQLLSQLL